MTTTITVKANHGWPVRVTPLDPKTGEVDPQGQVQIVPKDSEQTFHVHSTRDLLIHEMQPDEAAQELGDEAAGTAGTVADGDVG